MIDYAALRVVAAVVQTGSFEQAAALLNVTPSAVSQRVKNLEERLGTALIIRGNPCIPTEKGERLCSHMEQVGILEHDLLEQLPSLSAASDTNEKVILRIAANADSLGTWFLEGISDFTKSTNYLVHLSVDDEDYTAEWLQQGKVIAAVSSSDKPIPGCRRFSLGSLRYNATCSPEFSDRYFRDGVTPKTLAGASCLTFNQKDRLQSEWVEQVFQMKVNLPAHWLPSTQSFIEASLMSMGWGMNPAPLVGEHLSRGSLIELVPGKTLAVPLYWHINRLAADRISDLTQRVIQAARQRLV